MNNLAGCLGIAMLAVGAVLLLALIVTVPVYFLWNWLVPDLFHGPEVTFWQAWGLSTLAALLFKSNSPGKATAKA
jgi:hypothetical protein